MLVFVLHFFLLLFSEPVSAAALFYLYLPAAVVFPFLPAVCSDPDSLYFPVYPDSADLYSDHFPEDCHTACCFPAAAVVSAALSAV